MKVINISEVKESYDRANVVHELNAPHAGLYFGGKQSQYFAVGKITQEQVDDYAKRKGMPKSEAENWLRTMLSYEP